jgi:predicted enzyme related to lactoylglutathione lyase
LPERDGYIAGVPCWVDTTQPDPDGAARFYGALFGWDFEEAMPAGSAGTYLIGRLRGGDVAAVSSPPEGAPAQAVWNTYVRVENADDTAAKARATGGSVLSEPFEVMDAGRMAVIADPEGAVFCVWEAKAHKGANRQRARLAELQRPQHARSRGGEALLRRRLRLDDARPWQR